MGYAYCATTQTGKTMTQNGCTAQDGCTRTHDGWMGVRARTHQHARTQTQHTDKSPAHARTWHEHARTHARTRNTLTRHSRAHALGTSMHERTRGRSSPDPPGSLNLGGHRSSPWRSSPGVITWGPSIVIIPSVAQFCVCVYRCLGECPSGGPRL